MEKEKKQEKKKKSVSCIKLHLVKLIMNTDESREISSNISKTSASVSSGFQTRETFETTRPQAEWPIVFERLES